VHRLDPNAAVRRRPSQADPSFAAAFGTASQTQAEIAGGSAAGVRPRFEAGGGGRRPGGPGGEKAAAPPGGVGGRGGGGGGGGGSRGGGGGPGADEMAGPASVAATARTVMHEILREESIGGV